MNKYFTRVTYSEIKRLINVKVKDYAKNFIAFGNK